MKKIAATVLALVLALAAVPAPGEEAGSALTVLKENFIVREEYSRLRGTYIAIVRNDTDEPFFITGGSLAVLDAAGAEIVRKESVSYGTSRYLEPGETNVVSIQADIPEGAEAAGYAAAFTTGAEAYLNRDTVVGVAATDFEVREASYSTRYLMKATIANDGDEPMKGVAVTMVLTDAEGKPLFFDTKSMYLDELGPHSTITLVEELSSYVVDYITQNNIEVGPVEAYGFIELSRY